MSDYFEHRDLPPADNENTDVGPRTLLMLLAAFASIIAIAGLVVWWIYPSSMRGEMVAGATQRFPQPMLQPSPPADMQAFFADEMTYLYGTGWVDRARGTVHIPIGRAMEKLVRQGIPDWPSGSSVARPTPAAVAVPEGGTASPEGTQ